MEEIETSIQTPEGQSALAQTVDPFALDENALVSLTPEQRAGLEPVLESWKKKATEEITKRESSVSEKYKPYEEKATALDKLVNYQPFVQWWQEQQKPKGGTPTAPAQIATQEEWQNAIYEASQGDGTKLTALQQKMYNAQVLPALTELKSEQQKLNTQIELKDLFESHVDAKELDSIGLDPKTKQGTSLLEIALEWAERNGKSLEDGYNLAHGWADAFKVGAKQEAMGMLNTKRQEVTQGPSTSANNGSVVEVENMDDLIRKSLESQVSGQKDVRYVIKKG